VHYSRYVELPSHQVIPSMAWKCAVPKYYTIFSIKNDASRLCCALQVPSSKQLSVGDEHALFIQHVNTEEPSP
jgi:hypothetical protein